MADLAAGATESVEPAAARPDRSAGPARRYTAVGVSQLEKTFRIPKHQIQTFKERALHPFQRTEYHELRVLKGVSFEIEEGEFFGIVGRNGSGKSTLLKCMAAIYRADSGSIRVAGRISPFIELGVGFNPDLTARDNVILNAVMMGLTTREARARFDDIIAFAELEQFVEMKLKNYSSGMQVRLAFSVMVQSGADILLIDEVLAVGDAAFQQRCLDEFYRLRAEGKTIVLVTHDMTMVERFCHRALLLADGEIQMIGDPTEVGRRYLDLNFGGRAVAPGAASHSAAASIIDVSLTGPDGQRTDAVAHGGQVELAVTLEAHERIDRPRVELWVEDEDRNRIFGAVAEEQLSDALDPGERITVRMTAENRLASGHYYVSAQLLRGSTHADLAAVSDRARDFVVYGAERIAGVVDLDHTVEVERR
jgi:ABC-2 type transport system ATP-binding protein